MKTRLFAFLIISASLFFLVRTFGTWALYGFSVFLLFYTMVISATVRSLRSAGQNLSSVAPSEGVRFKSSELTFHEEATYSYIRSFDDRELDSDEIGGLFNAKLQFLQSRAAFNTDFKSFPASSIDKLIAKAYNVAHSDKEEKDEFYIDLEQ